MNAWLPACLFLAVVSPAFGVSAQAPQAAQAAESSVQALRQRVQDFYGLLQVGNSREAEKYVTEDSRENFRYQQRAPFLGFEIKTIKLDQDNKGAMVEVIMQTFAPGFSPKPIPMPSTSKWTLVGGVWYAIVPKPNPTTLKEILRSVPKGKPANPAQPPAEELKFKGHTYMLGRVNPGQFKTARYPFTNGTDHVVTITEINTGCDCLKAKTEKKSYKPGESGELAVTFDPTEFSRGYIQSMVVKTDPGGVVTYLTIKAFVMPTAPSDQTAPEGKPDTQPAPGGKPDKKP